MMEEDRLATPASLAEDGAEKSLRPQSFEGFVGQAVICRNLKIFIEAAKKREDALDHVLLFGAPGLGKTTLAQIIAHEMGAGFRMTSGPIISRAGDLAALLTNLQPRDVLFIDEIHRLNTSVEETLYSALEDFKLDLMIGEGPSARSVRIDLVPFTLVGATTRSGLLSAPLRDRFGILSNLVFYTAEELQTVLKLAARKLELELHPDAAFQLARRSRGTPRIALRLLRRVRDFAGVASVHTVEASLVNHVLCQLEIDQEGLDALDRRYLGVMASHFQGGPVGLDTLAACLGENRETLEEVVEPFLVQHGFVQRTARGRVLGPPAYEHLGITMGSPSELDEGENRGL